jgi:hypothetical protein
MYVSGYENSDFHFVQTRLTEAKIIQRAAETTVPPDPPRGAFRGDRAGWAGYFLVRYLRMSMATAARMMAPLTTSCR